MFTSFTSLEVLLGIGLFLLAAHELRGVLGARRDGRSTNVSRVITHGVMMLLLGVYFAFALSYYPLEASDAAIVSFDTPVVNWSCSNSLRLCPLSSGVNHPAATKAWYSEAKANPSADW